MWYDEMFQELEKLGDPAQSEKMAAYMQNLFPFLGVPKPELKVFMKPYLNQTRKQDFDWNFVFACWKKPYREAHYIGVEYVLLHKKQLGSSDLENLKYLITHQSWWETVDSLDVVVGEVVLKDPKLKKTMLKWSLDDNIWLRRVAIDYQQEYKMETDTEVFTQIISNNFGSTEFFVNKAIGWSLRDYSKVNPEWVRSFLEEHREQLAPLSIKEASKYL